jgi:hypothetical protein
MKKPIFAVQSDRYQAIASRRHTHKTQLDLIITPILQKTGLTSEIHGCG